jgi:hypothetical protein
MRTPCQTNDTLCFVERYTLFRSFANVSSQGPFRKRSTCFTYFERVAQKACLMGEAKIDMAARRQVANELRTQYRRASKADRKVLDRVVATTGMGRRRRGGC